MTLRPFRRREANEWIASVISMTPIELPNYYCPEKQAELGDGGMPLRMELTTGWLEVREVIGTRWKVGFYSRILWLSSLANAQGSQGRPDLSLGPLAYLVDPQWNNREWAFDLRLLILP